MRRTMIAPAALALAAALLPALDSGAALPASASETRSAVASAAEAVGLRAGAAGASEAAGVRAKANGGWAVTLLDPVPTRFESGHTYAVGFWVLQHGTHPFEGELEPVGLRLTRADGRSVTFPGTPLPEAGHYATSVAVPRGEWKVEALQGWFPPYEVGVLKVPGDLRVAPVPAQMVSGRRTEERWGAIRPPEVEPGEVPVYVPAPAAALDRVAAPAKSPAPGAQAQGTTPPVTDATTGDSTAGEDGTADTNGTAADAGSASVAGGRSAAPEAGVPAYALLIAAVAGAGLAVAALRLAARRRRQEPDPPTDPSADTLAFP